MAHVKNLKIAGYPCLFLFKRQIKHCFVFTFQKFNALPDRGAVAREGVWMKCASLPPVSASDCDSGPNAEVTYHTLSPDFSISPHGTIFPARPLDYERPNHLYEFVVMAVDRGEAPRTGTATVRVRVANVNDEAPEFSQPV